MQQAIRFYGFPLNCLLHMQLKPAFKWGHVLYKSICKISLTQSTTTHNMLAFITVVDVIPVQIHARDPAFLVRVKVTFWHHFCISLWISGTTWKWHSSSCDFIFRNKIKSKGNNSVPIFICMTCGGTTWCASSSTEVSSTFQLSNLLSVFSQWHCLLSDSFTFDAILLKPRAKLNTNVLFLQISHYRIAAHI